MIQLMLSLLSLLPLKGYTVDLSEFKKPVRVVGEELIIPEGKRAENPPSPYIYQGMNYVWDTTIDLYLFEGTYGVLSFSSETESLRVISLPDAGLTEKAEEAVQYAPWWLRNELMDNFHRLDTTYQNLYADLILEAPDLRIVDEVAFQVAHISPEILMDSVFDPELIIINASLIYQYADSLPYVEIIDYGLPPWSDDYYTTLGYYLVENGDTVPYLLPNKERLYYYYVVHPELSDESPRMDDYVYNKFWRDFLWGEVDSGYPILSEKLRDIHIVWDGEKHVLPGDREYTPGDLALDVVGHWAGDLVPWAASGNRPIQPNVIVYEHNGNCGEMQDALAAAGRTALLPITSVFTLAEDHVWDEFYLNDDWHEYQVDLGHGSTHIDDPSTGYDRQHGGRKDLSSVMEWRSDGKVRTVTSRYSNVCSLYVRVLDQAGRPVDGARVLLYSEYCYGGLSISCWGFTNQEGKCDFELGELRNFYIHINSPIGDYPSGSDEVIKIIETSQTGAHYYKTFVLPGYIPAPRPQLVYSQDTSSEYGIYMSGCDVYGGPILHGYVRARRNTGDTGFYHTYSERLDFWRTHCFPKLYLVDSIGLYSYENEHLFSAIDTGSVNGHGLSIPQGDYYVLISNSEALSTSYLGKVHITVYKHQITSLREKKERIQRSVDLQVSNSKGLILARVDIPEGVPYDLALFNEAGRKVKTLLSAKGDGSLETYKFHLRLPSGIYFVRLETPNDKKVKKVLWLNGGE